MVDKIKAIIILTVLTLLPSGLSAQQVSIESFWSNINEGQGKIDLLRQGMADAYNNYFEIDNLESIAYECPDPQAYIDYSLARYYRMISYMNDTAAWIADDIADYIRGCNGRVNLSSQVIQEGIAKYTDMRDFFLENARQNYSQYEKLWDKYSAKYGNMGTENFRYDDEYMKRYGTTIRE